MKITVDILSRLGACPLALGWAEGRPEQTAQELWEACDRPDWLMWVLWRSRRVDRRLLVEVACRAAEHVLPIYEASLPQDSRPREAIEAARRGDAEAARQAARAAWAATWEAAAAWQAARAARAAAAAAEAATEAATAAWAAAQAAAQDPAAERDWQCEMIREIFPKAPEL